MQSPQNNVSLGTLVNQVLGSSKFNELRVYTQRASCWKDAALLFRNAVARLGSLEDFDPALNQADGYVKVLKESLSLAEDALVTAEQTLQGWEEAHVTLAKKGKKTWRPVGTAMDDLFSSLLELSDPSEHVESIKDIVQAAGSLASASLDVSGLFVEAHTARRSEGLLNWYRLTHAMLEEPTNPTRTALETRMSAWQRSSFKVLYEWWTASYQDAGHSLAAIFDIIRGCADLEAVPIDDGGLEKYDWERIMRHLELKRWPVGDIEGPYTPGRPVVLIYHAAILDLFEAEFRRDAESEMVSKSEWCHILHQRRRSAMMGSFCHHLAWRLYNPSPLKLQECSSEGVEAAHNTATLSLAKGPVVEPCPWLPQQTENDSKNLPHFLWDSESCMTIETSSLDDYPIYTVISHTWGRWAKGEPPAEMDGVPWKVPQNWRFEILELPKLLKLLPSKTRYVWFDLLCIPQDHSALGAKEISRQAQIFQGARYAIAWLNDVESLHGLGYAMGWQVLHLLQPPNEDSEPRLESVSERMWELMSDKPSGLLSGYNRDGLTATTKNGGIRPLVHGTLNPWFTSLWTLQEVALRPDMWLCAKDFSFATSDGVTPLPLSGIVTIVRLFQDHKVLREGLPEYINSRGAGRSHAAINEVIDWAFLTGLDGLLNLDRVTILNLGDRRQCSGRRAEAIMSAMGVTRWYEKALNETMPAQIAEFSARLEEDLVLGKYPAEFVRELSESVPGSEFFNTVLKITHDPNRTQGSMLPFGVNTVNYMLMRPRPSPLRTHHSLSTWAVLPTGQVHIQQACVVASSSEKTSLQGIRCLMMFGDTTKNVDDDVVYESLHGIDWPGLRGLHQHSSTEDFELWTRKIELAVDNLGQDLGGWMESQKHDTYLALVSSYMSMFHELSVSGVVLQRLTPGSLVKTGHFFTSKGQGWIDTSKVDQVDWIVD